MHRATPTRSPGPACAGPAASGLPGFGRARSCILVYLFGGPSHLDIWDLKPEAPEGTSREQTPCGELAPALVHASDKQLLAGPKQALQGRDFLLQGDERCAKQLLEAAAFLVIAR